MLRAACYRLATAATAVEAERRWHEAGHFDGSDTGQTLDVAAVTAGVDDAADALTDERNGQLPPH